MKKLDIGINTVKNLYLKKQYSQDKISKILNCSQWVISNRLREHAIKTRPKTCKLSRRKYTYNNNFLAKISPDIAWVLGLLLSDGFVNKNRLSGYFGLKLKKEDKNVLIKMKKILNYTGPILKTQTTLQHKGMTKTFNFYLLQINDLCMFNQLNAIGIKKSKTLNEKFLRCIAKTKNEKIISSFIRGIYDGDGSLMYDKKRKSTCFQIVGTKQLLYKIQYYLMRYCRVNKTVLTRNSANVNHFALRYRGNIQAIRISKWIYRHSHPFNRMDRKFSKFCNIKGVIKK